MKKISFEGIGALRVTFETGEGLEGGQVCAVTAAGKVGPCAAGDKFCGVAEAVDDGLAAVQVGGFAPVRYSGALAAGWAKLAADGTGGVKADAAGREYLVAELDSAEKLAAVLL